MTTGRMGWMAHKIWKESKQQPGMLPGPAVPGCCLISFHFLWAIHPIRPVHRCNSVHGDMVCQSTKSRTITIHAFNAGMVRVVKE